MMATKKKARRKPAAKVPSMLEKAARATRSAQEALWRAVKTVEVVAKEAMARVENLRRVAEQAAADAAKTAHRARRAVGPTKKAPTPKKRAAVKKTRRPARKTGNGGRLAA